MAEPTPTPTPTPAPAPEPTPTPEPTPAPAPEPTPTPEPPTKSFSQEDIDAAVAAAKADWEKQAKLEKLPEDEKKQEELRIKEEEFNKKNAELERRILETEAKDMLKEKGISIKFASMLLGKDVKETKAKVEEFAKEWKTDVSAGVDEKLKGSKTPKSGGGNPPDDPFLAGFGK